MLYNDHNYINDVNIKIHSYDLTFNSDRWRSIKFFKEYSIWYVLSGSIKVKMDDEEIIAKEGDVILLYPNRLFSSSPIDKNFFLRSIHFDISFEQSNHLLELNDMTGLYPAEIFEKESKLFKEIFLDKKNDDTLSRIVLKGYILIILGKIFNYYNDVVRINKTLSKFNESDFNKLQKVYEYIYNNIEKRITIDELAKLINLSKNYFCAFFKKATGTSVQNTIYRAKMIKAKEYIRINKYPIKTISYLLGYQDQNAFSKAFKRYHKISPSKFL